jgi:hypothetical protein
MGTTRAAWNPEAILKKHQNSEALRALETKISTKQRADLEAAVARIDRGFIEGNAFLIRDVIHTVVREKRSKQTLLLQRSVWAGMDGIALHLDACGLAPVIGELANTLFRNGSLNEPGLVAPEIELIRSFASYVDKDHLTRAFAFAESHKLEKNALPLLTSASFTFREGLAAACGRPDKLLAVHAIPKWVPIAVFIANILVLLIPLVGKIISIVTIVVAIILALVAGC